MAGALYLHVPFCARKCAYCDFASWATAANDPLMTRYARTLLSQLDEVASLGLLADCKTAYIGGGTPSLLGEKALGALVSAVRKVAPEMDELTCEANPDSLDDGVLLSLREAGATRLSIGVQSLDDGELAELGRLHDATCARVRVRAAVASGLDVSVDLMCATPGQTDESWARTLEDVASLGVGHVSVYPLQIEEGTALEARYADDACAWNDDEVQAARMTQAQVTLEGHGYSRYEVASYSVPGKACCHNKAYWTGVSYLGLGTGASGMLSLDEYLRLRVVAPQLPLPPRESVRARLTVASDRRALVEDSRLSTLSFSLEFLSEPQAVAEDLMLGARLVEGLDPELVSRARALFGGRLDGTIEGLLASGLLAERGGRLAPTQRGWLLGNELYGALWDLAPSEVATARC
ncbi:radical SAM family heme chaperone HemW [Thermophilibacter provencensis]|uniref:Heme chaperone HemW n=1 Tax=Thermophilibacter provencensis TaxID=1852386 RepID=A0ABT7V306_9ACTN|nr:radical SAM family heme chaperone HemW [Thermophilibacter provencensis]MDM8270381.1 radical SAM family heme chaperone HemW [Thermophilibacter provencensis]